jgi:hypothetical protein
MPVLERFQALRIEAADALAHGLTIKTDPGCNRRGALAALARQMIWARCTLWAGAVWE